MYIYIGFVCFSWFLSRVAVMHRKEKKLFFEKVEIDKKKIKTKRNVRQPGIEPGSIAWKATMLTFTPPTLYKFVAKQENIVNLPV